MKPLSKLALISLLSLCSPFTQASTSVNLNPSNTTIKVGDDFYVDVLVQDVFANSPGDELLGFGFNSLVSNRDLQFLDSAVNPLFVDTSASVGLNATGLAFPSLTAATMDPIFSLATLHFKALAAGSVSVALVSDLADPNQGLIFLNQQPLSIAASLNLNISAVPVPAVGWMFVSVLGLFVTVARRR